MLDNHQPSTRKLAKSDGRLVGTIEDAFALPRQFRPTCSTLAKEIASFLPRPLCGGSRSPTGVGRVTNKIGSGGWESKPPYAYVMSVRAYHLPTPQSRNWWRRGESNPCPMLAIERIHMLLLIDPYVSHSTRKAWETARHRWFAASDALPLFTC